MVRDAKKWEVEPERTAAEFDAGYYRKLLEKAWGEAAFVFNQIQKPLPLTHPLINQASLMECLDE